MRDVRCLAWQREILAMRAIACPPQTIGKRGNPRWAMTMVGKVLRIMPLTPRSLSGLGSGGGDAEEEANLTASSPNSPPEPQVLVLSKLPASAVNGSPPGSPPSRLSKLRDRVPLKLLFSACLILTVFVLLLLSVVLNAVIGSVSQTANRRYQTDMVEAINRRTGAQWTAVLNPFAKKAGKIGREAELAEKSSTKPEFKSWTYLEKKAMKSSEEHAKVLDAMNVRLPRSFDARDKWPRCYSIHQIYNQGGCGSCYATVAASVISDRICIQSNYTDQPIISVEDIVTCCKDYLGKNCNSGGCGGGVGLDGFLMWRDAGLVTGGPFGSIDGCKPYSHDSQCGAPCPEATYASSRTKECRRRCQNLYGPAFEEDKWFGSTVYRFDRVFFKLDVTPSQDSSEESLRQRRREQIVKRELFVHGPLSFCFTAYEDLQHYESGVYGHVQGDALMGHCVKLIGWDDAEPSWRMVNTWGRDWGEAGTFRMNRSISLIDLNGGLPRRRGQL